jgi:SAM-dependent methyltransferase
MTVGLARVVWSHRTVTRPTMGWGIRHLTLDEVVGRLTPGTFIEFGGGAGLYSFLLARRGWSGFFVEADEGAREIAGPVLRGTNVRVVNSAQKIVLDPVDLVLSSEVIEHIPDDQGMVNLWASWLKLGGLLVLTTPAHAHLWSVKDEEGGHVRRYSREALARLIEDAGLVHIQTWSYGFPIFNLLWKAGIWQSQLRPRPVGTPAELTYQSWRSRFTPRMPFLIWYLVARSGQITQRAFKRGDRGYGYIVIARKSG